MPNLIIFRREKGVDGKNEKENDEKYKNECIIGIELAKKLKITKKGIYAIKL